MELPNIVYPDTEKNDYLPLYYGGFVTINKDWLDIFKESPNEGGLSVSWDSVVDKPKFVAAGDTNHQARQVIGAGTSNLRIGPASNEAAAGNHDHKISAHAASGMGNANTLQHAFNSLSIRIKALEDAAGL